MNELQRNQILRYLLFVGCIILFGMILIPSAAAQPITLRGTANPSISIIAGTAGGSMTSVVNTSSQIRYRRQAGIK